MRTFRAMAILFFWTAIIMMMTSCSVDNEIVPEAEVPTTVTWCEPYHVKGATYEQVKAYMSVKQHGLILSEQASAYAFQLVYSDRNSARGIVYSFSTVDNGLYSVIDTEPMSNWNLIMTYLEGQYKLIGSNSGSYIYADSSKSVIVSMSKVNDEYFNLSYDFAL